MDADVALTVRVARIMAPITVLGPGSRVGLWVQGCALACPGCASRDTWDPGGGHAVDVSRLRTELSATLDAGDLTGLTITGGEPTDQAGPLAALVRGLRDEKPDLDVLVFTGRTLGAAKAVAPELMALATAIVAGPYRRDLPLPGHRLLSTANQTLHVMDRAEDSYRRWLADERGPRVQTMVTEEALYLIGMPQPGDLDKFRAALADRGVTLEGVSW